MLEWLSKKVLKEGKMYSYNSRIRYSEVNEKFKLSLISLVDYFQDCAAFESEDKNVGFKWMMTKGTMWMLMDWHIKIFRRPMYSEKVTISSKTIKVEGYKAFRNFEMKTEAGETLAAALSIWAFIDMKAGVPTADIPQEELDAYGMEAPLDIEFDVSPIEQPKDATKGEPITIVPSNLDSNHHVNNAEYVTLALSVLPDEVKKVKGFPKEFRVEYRKQTFLGEELTTEYTVTENKAIVVLRGSKGEAKCVTEFIY